MKSLDKANSRLSDQFAHKHVTITPDEIESVYKRMILSIDADAKTSKGVQKGYLTGILYLSPSDLFTDVNVCPFASESCRSACLFSAGRGRFYSVTRARVIKTLAWINDPERFIFTVSNSIDRLKKKAKKLGLIPVVRLNGTSDINWGNYNLKDDIEFINIFEYHRDIQFYDYTKRPRPAINNREKNYHFTFSDSGTNQGFIDGQPQHTNIATVFMGELPATYNGKAVINGDESDLRFLDPQGVIVGLKAKGTAKIMFTSSFVKDNRK